MEIDYDNKGCTVTPLFAKSSVISSLSRASGYIIVPEAKKGLKGEKMLWSILSKTGTEKLGMLKARTCFYKIKCSPVSFLLFFVMFNKIYN